MFLLTTPPVPDHSVTLAIIASLTTLLAIVIAALVARFISHPKTPTENPDADRPKSEPILAQYSGEQNEFIHMVMTDSKELHDQVDRLDSVVERMKKERATLISAFGRYISKLANAWGSGGKMPYPDEEDLMILEETLPGNWRTRPKQ